VASVYKQAPLQRPSYCIALKESKPSSQRLTAKAHNLGRNISFTYPLTSESPFFSNLRVFVFINEGVVIKSLSDFGAVFKACLLMRAEDTSRAVNEFARALLRRFAPQVLPSKQIDLPPCGLEAS
jgi:hypothetical protein